MFSDLPCCNNCGKTLKDCKCEISDFLTNSSNEVMDAYVKIYSEIAEIDSMHALQDSLVLEKKAIADLKIISKYVRVGSRVLEVGPGLGHLAKLLHGEGVAYFSTDVTPTYLKFLKGKKFLSNIERLPKFENNFDVVIACDVFEHVLNEGDAAISVYSALKNNGVFFIRTPYKEPLINYATNIGSPFPFVHLRTYDKSSLKQLLFSAGFRKLEFYKRCDSATGFSRRTPFVKAKMRRLKMELASSFGAQFELSTNSMSSILFSLQVRLEGIVLGTCDRYFSTSSALYRFLLRFFYNPNEIVCIAIK